MSYRAGTRGLAALGIPDSEPRVICDGCGVVLHARTRSGGPPAWLLNGTAPKGWAGGRNEDGTRWDRCPRCKASR